MHSQWLCKLPSNRSRQWVSSLTSAVRDHSLQLRWVAHMIVHKHLNELFITIVTVDCLIELIVINEVTQGPLHRDLNDTCLILLLLMMPPHRVLFNHLVDRVRGKLNTAWVDLSWVLFHLCRQVLVLVFVFLLVFVLLSLIFFVFELLYLLLHDHHSRRLHLIIVLVSIEFLITIVIISER